MYEAFFNLKNKPFSLLPDPEFLFLSSRHAIGLSLLEYSLTGQAGFCVITGEIGSGKTTLVRAFLNRVGRDFTVGLISNTHHALKDIAAWAMTSFGQKPSGTHPAETYQELMEYLIAEYGAGRQCILIVDEAQNLSIEVLEELRLLSNINSGKDLLLQVVLVGQPELLDKLRRPELSQFAQRIAVSHHLTPLPYAETRRYIEHRVKVAGCDRPLFTEMAMGAIQYFSGGIPRLVNSICDMALVYGFADEQPVIGEDLVFRVVSDRQLSGIAPFAQSVPVDDPAVRAEIMKLTNLGAAPAPAPAAPEAAPVARRAEPPRAPVHLEPVPTEPIQAEPAHQGSVHAEPVRAEPIPAEPMRAEAVRAEPFRAEPVRVEPTRRSARVAPVLARQMPPPEAVVEQVLVDATPLRETQVQQDAPAREVFLREGPAREVPLKATAAREAGRANPYFFREVEDDEELLLTAEMNDSSLNAHNLMTAAPRSTPLAPSAPSQEREEPYLEVPRMAPNSVQTHAPNQTHAMEENQRQVVDPLPWPSINDRRLTAPISTKEHGTGTPPRRSWWRRSIGRNS
jgi:type II secretory pathway predicted ATPase ExeA